MASLQTKLYRLLLQRDVHSIEDRASEPTLKVAAKELHGYPLMLEGIVCVKCFDCYMLHLFARTGGTTCSICVMEGSVLVKSR